MGTFALRDGERELARTHATDARKHVAGALVLTERRVVLLANDTKGRGFLAMMFGLIGIVMAAMTAGEKVTTEIARTELAGVELIGPNTLKLFNSGEGYGYIWFEVTIHDAERWLSTIQYWAEHGTIPGDYARLPVATVVKRG